MKGPPPILLLFCTSLATLFLPLDHWSSTGTHFDPQETFGNVWRHCGCHRKAGNTANMLSYQQQPPNPLNTQCFSPRHQEHWDWKTRLLNTWLGTWSHKCLVPRWLHYFMTCEKLGRSQFPGFMILTSKMQILIVWMRLLRITAGIAAVMPEKRLVHLVQSLSGVQWLYEWWMMMTMIIVQAGWIYRSRAHCGNWGWIINLNSNVFT